jgi:hypothetical protein
MVAKKKTRSNAQEQTNSICQAKWTVMVYFAADNDLDDEAMANLRMMKRVGSTQEVNIVAQFDSRREGSTFRFLLRDERTTLDEDVVGPRMPEVNTGDPRELTDFIEWGIKEYPSQHIMLVLWGHGRGWEDLDNSDRAAAPTTDSVVYRDESGDEFNGFSIAITKRGDIRPFVRAAEGIENLNMVLPSGGLPLYQYSGRYADKRASQYLAAGERKETEGENLIGLMAHQTPERGSELSQDVLKMDELSNAIEKALDGNPDRKIDIFGMDACMMGMAEVGYQVRGRVRYLVASEDAIPDENWPYDRILTRLVENPSMTPEELSVTIVREYLLHYRERGKDVAKSVCDLSRSRLLVDTLKELAAQLMYKMSDDRIRLAVMASRAMSQSFYIKDYVDLYHFCAILRRLCQDEEIKTICTYLMDAIRHNKGEDEKSQDPSQSSRVARNFVFEYGFIGHRLRDANGVSIYFPCAGPSPKYAELSFAKDSKWGEFLSELGDLFPEQEDSKVNINSDHVKSEEGTQQKVPLPLHLRVPPLIGL